MSSEFKIDKGVPCPSGRRRTKYPFGDMDVGDSFACAEDQVHRIVNAATYYGHSHGMKFSTKSDGNGGFRCWRLTDPVKP